MLVPVAEVINNLFITKKEASFGIGPAIIDISRPKEVHKEEDTLNGEKPLLVKVTLELGLKIPMLYSITATITMIKMAQPYVIMYSKADCDLLLFIKIVKCLVVCV